jgi:iodothyronine deiodinase-like protein
VYIEEAHATDAWQTSSNVTDKVLFATPKSFEDRAEVGATCVKDLKVELPMVVDEIDNRTERAYTAWPDRLYVLDRDGRIIYKSLPGPFGFKVEPIAKALESLAGPAVVPARPS